MPESSWIFTPTVLSLNVPAEVSVKVLDVASFVWSETAEVKAILILLCEPVVTIKGLDE